MVDRAVYTRHSGLFKRCANPFRFAVALIALAVALAGAAPAVAAAPLGLTDCREAQGVHQCTGLVRTWDGVPLDTTVTLPSAGASRLPLVAEIHGFGNSRYEYLDPESRAYTDNAYGWAKRGYAVLTYTARGLWGSCGTPDARAANPADCARGYIHLADTRYEVRDTQELIGRLVDDGVADPARIGLTGDSYGGGQIVTLAALRDRVMQPDGRLIPWRSPGGVPLRLAAAAPVIPWTDLMYAALPNGRTFTYTVAPQSVFTTPVGVFKTSVGNAIFAAAEFAIGPGQPTGEPFVPGRPMGFLAPPGVDAEADVTRWVARADAGEPYTDPTALDIVERLERHHSPYGVEPTSPPPPLFVASGFTDDIFPVDEALRFVNRMRRDHPRTPVSLLFADFGHQRASNKTPERERLVEAVHAWLDHYVRREGPAPREGVTALTQTCPRDAASEGPFSAARFDELARGEVRFASGALQTVVSGSGDPAVARAVDPALGGGDACAQTAADMAPGTADYRLPPAPRGGYVLLGAPTVVARLTVDGEPRDAQVAARLWDVAPDGRTQTLVARGLYRPSGRSSDVWQLHANGWRFAEGHVPRLELLGTDLFYARPSNDPFRIDVERLELRLPVRDKPDCTVVMPTAALVVPPGQELAPGVSGEAAPGCERGGRRPAANGAAGESRSGDGASAGSADAGSATAVAGADTSARTGAAARLPFTGLALALLVGMGLALVSAGALMHRRSGARRKPHGAP
ncbi:MAG TPA: CocE/NonD family hydrolase [Thermoleophilaceae bacterium]|jgi:dienelactone hydrolase